MKKNNSEFRRISAARKKKYLETNRAFKNELGEGETQVMQEKKGRISKWRMLLSKKQNVFYANIFQFYLHLILDY